MNVTLEQVATIGAGIVAIFAALVAVVAWLFKTGIAPLRTVIENNTVIVKEATDQMKKMDTTLREHELKINTIETIHEIRGCGDGIGKRA